MNTKPTYEELEHRVKELEQGESELKRLTKQLRDSEDRFKAFSDAAFEGIVITEKGIILEVNDIVCKMLGFHSSEFIGKAVTELISLEERDNVKSKILSGFEHIYETRCLRKDGSSFPVEVQGKRILHKGKQARVTAVRDVSGRKCTEDLLKEREQIYRTLFENNSSVMVLIDPETYAIFDANQSACSYYGYSKEDLIGMRITDINVLSEKELCEEMERAKSEKKKCFNFSHRLSDGTIRDVEVFSGPIIVDGKLLLCSIIHDISERKKAEEEKKIERQRLYSLLDTLPAFVYLQSPDYSIRFANKYYTEHFGETEGLPCYKSLWGRDKPCEVCPTFKVFRSGKPQKWEWDSAPDGRIYEVHDYPFTDTDGKELVFELGMDITERRKMENEIVKIKKLEATSVLAGGIAHDFNNLLTVIIAYIDMAMFDLGPHHRNTQDLGKALEASKKAHELTNKFITFSSGGTPVKRKSSIKELIVESVESILSQNTYQTDLSMVEDLWNVELDKGLIAQVFMNVLLNAKEAMPGGGNIQISAENIASINNENIVGDVAADSDFVKITITDQGKGIADHVMQNIFDPYFSTKERGVQKGMGLGLTVALSIVKQHDGYIVINSKENVGTSVHIYLPVAAGK